MRKINSVFLSVLVLSLLPQAAMAAPYEVYGRISMGSADYYIDTDRDEEGNDRLRPSKTTFSETDATSGATKVENRFTIQADYGTDAKYVYSSDKAEKNQEWARAISKVTVLSSDGDDIFYMPSSISYVPQEDGLLLKTDKLESGLYTTRIYAEGYNTFALNLEIRRPAPTITINGNYYPIYVGAKAYFKLDMTTFGYLWENPIYDIQLDGKSLSEEQCAFTFDSIYIQENVLTTAGTHTLTVKSHGFYDASITFDVKSKGQVLQPSSVNVPQNSVTIDALTSATSSGGSIVDAVSSATGGGAVPAFLTFNFDMIANASILREYGKETKESKSVLDWWELARKESVRKDLSTTFYDWADYVNAVEENPSLSFETYTETKGKKYSAPFGVWDMWETKNVLENGKLGGPYDLYEQIAKPNPEVTVAYASWDQGVQITFPSDAQWSNAIKKVHVDGTELNLNEYTLTDSSLTFSKQITGKRFSKRSIVKLEISEHKTITLPIQIVSSGASYTLVQEDANYYVGDEVVLTGLPEKITGISVSINQQVILSSSALGDSSPNAFKVQGQTLLLRQGLFTEPGEYKIKVSIAGYQDQEITVHVLEKGAKPKTYQIAAINDVSFSELVAGYTSAVSKMVQIKNTGNVALENIAVTASGGDKSSFILELGAHTGTLAPEETIDLHITPKVGLAADQYKETISISADHMVPVSFAVSQTVKQTTEPEIPEEPEVPSDFEVVIEYATWTDGIKLKLPQGLSEIITDVSVLQENQSEYDILNKGVHYLLNADSVIFVKDYLGNTFTKKSTIRLNLQGNKHIDVPVVIESSGSGSSSPISAIDDVLFDNLIVGYKNPSVKTVFLKNTTSDTLMSVTATVSGDGKDSFVLSSIDGLMMGMLPSGQTASLSIKPKAGLDAGIYTATVSISAPGMTTPVTFNVSVTVEPK